MQIDKNIFHTYLRVMHYYLKRENLLDAAAPDYYNIALGQLADFVMKRNPIAVTEIFRWYEPDRPEYVPVSWKLL